MIGATVVAGALTVTYIDDLQGIIRLQVTDLVALNAVMAKEESAVKAPVFVTFSKRGMAGVPTFMDWNGCCGSAKILLQK